MKKFGIKIAAAVLCIAMLAAVFTATGLSFALKVSAAGDYVQSFESTYAQLTASGLWATEARRTSGSGDPRGFDLEDPKLTDGVMKLKTGEGVNFLWTKADNCGVYSSSKAYVFDLDIKLTDSGNNSNLLGPDHTRVLYVSFGGWYNQVELNNRNGVVRVGNNYNLTYSEGAFLNKTVHIRVTLEGTTITTTLSDAMGNVLSTGSRTSGDYSNFVNDQESMKYFNLRCEDGAVEVDNFRFSVTGMDEADSTQLSIPSGKQAIYSNTLEYISGTKTTVKLGDKELFSISDDGMRVCGARVLGDYKTGKYGIKVYIAPQQSLMYVEVTLADGGTLRRGSYDILGGSIISVISNNVSGVGNGSVTYSDISINEYELVNTEPQYSGFEANVYNLVSSFQDASTTRYFAWTARASFIGSSDMAVQYREKGTEDFSTVDARRQTEKSYVSAEDYFKAELTGLKADTEYEYKIGKKGSDSAEDWGSIHSFKTAAANIGDFKFVAIGDTQSLSWAGDTTGDKGYKYSMAAIQEAMEEVDSPAFILNAGDVSDTGSDLSQWNWYFKSLGQYATSVPHFATIGNHDTWTNDQNNYFSLHFNHADNGKNAMDSTIASGATGGHAQVQISNYEDTVYSYNYGRVHFIVLNSGVYSHSDDEYIQKAQRAWLEADLEANANAEWTVILTHEAIYHRKGGAEDRKYLNDIIEKYGVDLVLQGHSHLVTRTYPMKNGEIVTKTSPDLIEKGVGTVYTTIGSTTLNHDSIGDPNVEECLTVITPDNTQPTYTVVSLEGNKLVVTVKQINGYVVDSFSIVASQNDNGEEGDTDNTQPDSDTDNKDDALPDTDTDINEGTVKPSETTKQTADSSHQDKTEAPTPAKKGCGSTVGSLAVMAFVLPLGYVTVRKRKE